MQRLLLVLLFALPVTGLLAQTDSVDAKIAHLLTVSGAEAQFLAAVDNMLAMQQKDPSVAVLPDSFWVEFSREIHEDGWKQLEPELIRVYRDNYTEAEIDHQIAYFEHPMTQQLVAKQAAVMQQSMAVGGRWGQEIGTKIARKLSQAVEEEKN